MCNFFLLDTEKPVTTLSLVKLKEIYKTQYEEFEKDVKDDENGEDTKFKDNLFKQFSNSLKTVLNNYNTQVVDTFNVWNIYNIGLT